MTLPGKHIKGLPDVAVVLLGAFIGGMANAGAS